MSDLISQDVQEQMAPGGRFPGYAETLATPVGSKQPVRVKVGQKDNRHLCLTKEEFRKRSAQQKSLDAQSDQLPAPQSQNEPKSAAPKKRGRPKGSKNRQKGADQPGELIGRPYPAASTTAAPAPAPIEPGGPSLSQRMDRLEQSLETIARHLNAPPIEAPRSVPAECPCDPEQSDDDDDVDEVEDDPNSAPERARAAEDAPTGGESAESAQEWDRGMQALQQVIVKRDPKKQFRRQWYSLSHIAQYNEWPPERREAFDTLFDSIVAHPKFVHQISKFLRGSRSGQCIGNEQIARVCGMMAGFLTVYQLAQAGK